MIRSTAVLAILVFTAALVSRAADSPTQKSTGYGSPATAKPMPANPYSSDPGLSITELANSPGKFQRNPPLPSSVPLPVLPNALNDMPDAPPFVSPAFVPRNIPAPGTFPSQSQR